MTDTQSPNTTDWSSFLGLSDALPFLSPPNITRIESLLGVTKMRECFRQAALINPTKVFDEVIRRLGLHIDYGDLLERIPQTGPAIVIANHPYGGIDAISLPGLCSRVRPDTVIMANSLASFPSPHDQQTIGVDIMDTSKEAARANLRAMRRCLAHLKSDGQLVIFPAGAVSRWNPTRARLEDPEWSHHAATLAKKTGAPILPVRYFGNAPAWFQILGTLHPMLRAALITRVCAWSHGHSLSLRAGDLITVDQLNKHIDPTAFLRHSVAEIPEA